MAAVHVAATGAGIMVAGDTRGTSTVLMGILLSTKLAAKRNAVAKKNAVANLKLAAAVTATTAVIIAT